MPSIRFIMVLIVAASAAGCGEALTDYRDESGGFRIRLPGPASPDTETVLPKGVKAVRYVERGGSYTVAWQDLDLTQDERSAEQRLVDACDAVASLKGKELARKSITLGAYPGRELVLQTKSGKTVIHDRMYLVDKRLYSVLAQGERWWVERPATRKVLDSFRLLEE